MTKEKIQEQIDKLEEKLSALKERDKENIILEYQWLIGICLNRAYTSMERIIGITDVIFRNGKAAKIELECVHIFYDDRNADKCTRIEVSDYPQIDCETIKEYIDEYSVPLTAFNDFFNKAVNAITNL